jgi:hypothetical protein
MTEDVKKNEQIRDVTRDSRGRWLKGIPAPPGAGRPPASRSKFSEAFVADFMADWREHGPAVLERVRTNNPSTYIRVAAILVPKELNVSVEQKAPGGLDADSYAALRRLLDIIQASGVEGEPQAVFERIEAALRADAATLIEQN